MPGNTVSITGSPRDILSASSGSSARALRCRSPHGDSSPTILPSLTSCTSSGRSFGTARSYSASWVGGRYARGAHAHTHARGDKLAAPRVPSGATRGGVGQLLNF
jgi:hypothetical protein